LGDVVTLQKLGYHMGTVALQSRPTLGAMLVPLGHYYNSNYSQNQRVHEIATGLML
jgi:hypothetical protein